MDTFLNHNEEEAIKFAYKNFQEKEFLDRLFNFINTRSDLVRDSERWEQKKLNSSKVLTNKCA